MRRLIACAAGLLAVAAGVMTAQPSTAAGAFTPPQAKHVWVIELENKSFDAAFVQNTNTYLWKTLPSQGKLLRQYYGTGHFSLDNYISELSGQAPNVDTQADCQRYMDVVGGLPVPDSSGQYVGQGCVYPVSVKTLANQLTEHRLTWRGYMQDMGKDPSREESTCGRPKSGGTVVDPSGLGGSDGTQSAAANDQYAARHNPFIYFHAITDTTACAANVLPLPQLFTDLKKVSTTPSFSFITPNLCDDAHDATCAGKNYGGKNNQGGLYAADQFLKRVVPLIQASPAYQQDGIILVTLDESGDVGTPAGATSCCGEPTGPNTPAPGQVGPGGGRIGTIVVSKRFVKPGTVSDVPYNHYSFLRSMEDLFRIGPTASIPGSDGRGHLGYAGAAGLAPFGKDVYDATAASGTPPRAVPAGTTGTSGSGSLPSTGLPAYLPVLGLALPLLGFLLVVVGRPRRVS